jgi:hypothetical protein
MNSNNQHTGARGRADLYGDLENHRFYTDPVVDDFTFLMSPSKIGP